MKKIILLLIISLILTGCNFGVSPGSNGDDVATSVAATLIAKSINETVAASNSQDGQSTATLAPVSTNTTIPTIAPTITQLPTQTMIPTNTIVPSTNTPIPTATTSIACNVAGFIADVTIPDGTTFAPNEAFTKTWRLKNMGSCAWTTSYKLVFSHGDQMSGAGEVVLPITVPPGQSVDVSINLTTPNPAGTYRGNYKLMDANGNLFGLSNGSTFYVEIISSGFEIIPLLPEIPFIPGILFSPTEFSPTEIYTANPNGVSAPGAFIVGDYGMNVGYSAFMKFDLSGIPDGSTITSARIEFPNFNIEGNPFGDLECLRAYAGSFFPISTADVVFESTGASGRACSMADTTNYILNAGNINNEFANDDILELKFQFNRNPTDNDNAADRLTAIGASGAKLIVEYSAP